jgi:8-oxo-dGTP pyrophosphatase MutT (NUDIX family)
MLKKKYRKAVFVVVYRKNKGKPEYLLLKRKLHWKGWEFCKGGADSGESLKKTAIREVKEESGLRAKNIKKHNKSGKYRYEKELADRPGIIGQKYVLFSAEVGMEKVKLDKKHKEHSSHKWMSFEKAVNKLKWPNQKACLRLVHKSLNNR